MEDSRKKRAASGQLAVSGKQCDNKKARAIQNFTQRERVRKGTDKVLQGRQVSTKAPTQNPVVAKFQSTLENIFVAPIRCPTKKQEARQQLRNVGRGFQDALGNVGNAVGGAVNGVTGTVGNAIASLQRTAGGRA